MALLLRGSLPALMLFLALPAQAADDNLTLSKNGITIVVADEIMAESDKVEALKEYEILSRIEEGFRGYLEGVSESATAEIKLTAFRLRSGAAGFFGFSGDDYLDGRVTVEDKDGQVAHYSAEAEQSNNGADAPPTRRAVELVHEFNRHAGMQLKGMTGNLPFMPGR